MKQSSSYEKQRLRVNLQEQSRSNPSLTEKESYYLEEGLSNETYNFIIVYHLIKNVQIVDSQLEEESGTIKKNIFVKYQIKVKTDYFDYCIEKRFKQFYQLKSLVKQNYGAIRIKNFPEKKLFGSIEQKTIDDRIQKLNKFLQTLLDNLFIHHMYEFLDFLEIQQQFDKKGLTNMRIHEISNDLIGLQELKNTALAFLNPQGEEDKMVLNYIKKLNDREEEKAKIFKKMEKYFFGKTQKLSPNIIQYLFLVSYKNFQYFVGILLEQLEGNNLSFKGRIHKLRTACFVKILQYDYNSNAHIALKQLQEVGVKYFKEMKIQNHIGGQNYKQCKQDALFILDKYLSGNTGMNEQFIKYMLDDESAYFEYQQYLQKQFSYQANQISISDQNEDPCIKRVQTSVFINNLEWIFNENFIINDLQHFVKQKPKWKLVESYEQSAKLSHIQGKLLKLQIQMNISLEQAYELMWQHFKWDQHLNQKNEVIGNQNYQINNYLIKKSQKIHNMTLIHKRSIEKEDDKIIIIETGIIDQKLINEYINTDEDFGKQQIIKWKKLGLFSGYTTIKKKQDDQTQIKVIYALQNETAQIFFSPMLLNENQMFQNTIQNLNVHIK